MESCSEQELADLLRAAIAGDERAYREFLRRTAELVRAFARRRIVQGGIESEDIVQDALLAIHAKRHTWRTDEPVTPWLYAIARYKLVDALRRQGRRMDINIEEVADHLPAPAPETISAREIGRALDSLAPGQRSVVAAISVEGRSMGETAQALDMSEAAVRVAFHRGLAAIARRFGRH